MDAETKLLAYLLLALVAVMTSAQVASVVLQRKMLNEDRWRRDVFEHVLSPTEQGEAMGVDQ